VTGGAVKDVLGIEGLSRHFGGIYAIRNVSIALEKGELRGVIGPNGAGKSTLFHVISGHLRPDAGRVILRGEPIGALSPHERARRGISIVFQSARIFRGMTVRENVMVGAHARTRHGFVEAAFRLPRHRREEREIRESADEALARVGLLDWADRAADALPLGQQRSMQVARAVCAKPSLLLLDEPASGLRSSEREQLARLIDDLHRGGLTTMLIEHDVSFVTRLADRITVLDLGQVIAEGTPDEVRRDDRVITAYLGRAAS
jgi:branched-chain amino acid transport system ATP-binding protein